MATGDPKKAEILVLLRDLFTGPGRKVAETAKNIGDSTARAGKSAEDGSRGFTRLTAAVNIFRQAAGVAVSSINGLLSSLTSLKTLVGTAIAVFTGGLAVRSILQTADALDEFRAAARRTGESVADLSKLRVAAKLSNVEFNQLVLALQLFRRAAASLGGNGGKQVREAINAIGLDPNQVRRAKSLVELLPQVADGFKQLSENDRLLRATQLFGRSGALLLPLLEQGSGKLRESLRIAEEFGLVLDTKAVDAADRLTDAIDLVSFAVEKSKAAIIGAFGDRATELLEQFARKLSDLPRLAGGIAAAFATAGDKRIDSKTRNDAADAVQQVVDASGKLIVGLATNIGKVIAVAFLEVLSVGFEALQPTLNRVFRDAVGPILNQIPGVNIEPTARTRLVELEQIASRLPLLDEKIRSLREEEDRLIEMNERLREGPLSGAGFGAEIAEVRRQITSTLDDIEKAKTASASLDDQRARVLQEQKRQNKALVDAITEAGSAAGSAYKKAKENVSALADNLQAALEGTQKFRVESKATAADSDLVRRAFDSLLARVNESRNKMLDNFAEWKKLRPIVADLDAAIQSAFGNEQAAERQELLNKQLERRRALEEKLQDLFSRIEPKLRALEKAENDALEVRQSASAIVDELTKKEQAYKDAVEARDFAIKAGQITQRAASAENRKDAGVFLEVVRAREKDLQSLRDKYPAFKSELDKYGRAVEDLRKRLEREGQAGGRSFSEGFADGLRELRERAGDAFDQGRRLSLGLADALDNGVSRAIDDIGEKTQNIGELASNVIGNILKDVGKLILRLLVIEPLVGAIAGGLGSLFAPAGGAAAGAVIPKFSSGGPVPGAGAPEGTDNVLARLQSEEFVVKRSAARFYGRARMNAINNMLVPRDAILGSSRASVAARSAGPVPGYADGGPVSSRQGETGPSQIGLLVANESLAERLIAGGQEAFRRFLVNNSHLVVGARRLGVQG